MTLATPPELIAAIEEVLTGSAEQARPGRRVPLTREIRALSELFALFTAERPGLRRLSYADNPRLRNAYLRYHLPLNVARATRALADVLRARPEIAALDEVVDLGAGPGSASLAAFFTLPPSPPRRYRLLDRSRAVLQVGRRLLARSAELANARREALLDVGAETATLPALPRLPPRALVWLAMVLNELDARSGRGRRAEPAGESLLARLAERLEPPSAVIIIEPALRAPGRRLLALHDAAVASGAWTVIAPCTHGRSCPLLRERDRSWCHFRFAWDAPRMVREVAEPLRLDHTTPSFSYLALARREPSAPVPSPRPDRARVIGDPMPVRGGGRAIYVCREGQRELAGQPPAPIERGDVVTLGVGDRLSVEAAWRGRPEPGR